jgi:hypothetical protein
LKLLKHKEIDFKKWDQVILNSELPLVFAQSFYLNATCPDWNALITDDYKSVMPVTSNKKLGINYILQPPFTPQLGIFGVFNKKVANDFFNLLKVEYKYISIELNSTNIFDGFDLKDKRTFVIDYIQDYVFNSNTKRNIVKANKAGLVVEEVTYTNTLALNKKYLHPFLKNKLKIKPKQIKLFDQLLINSIENKYLNTLITKDRDGKIVAIAHFISNGKHAVYLKGTSFDKISNSGSMHLLMSKAIELFKIQKVKLFDFGGGQGESMAQFYSGFGAKEMRYKIYKINNLPKPIKWIKT